MTQPHPTILLVDPSTPLGESLFLQFSNSSDPNRLRVVKRNILQTLGTHCLAANKSAAFVYVTSPDQIPENFGKTVRIAVCVMNVSKMDADMVRACSQRESRMRHVQFTVAHNVEECCDFIMAFLTKISDPIRTSQAQQMILEAAAVDRKKAALAIFEKGLQIECEEGRVLAEACGSLADLASMSGPREIASKSPLSNANAQTVAEILGLSHPTQNHHHQEVSRFL